METDVTVKKNTEIHIMVEDFNILPLKTDKMTRQKISKVIEDLNNAVN